MKITNDISKKWKNRAQPRRFEPRTIARLFCKQAKLLQDRPFLWFKKGKVFFPISYAEAYQKAAHLASHLIKRGIAPGDRIVLASENRPEWALADFAIMLAGAVPVSAYATNSVEDHRHIIHDSGASAVICSSSQISKIRQASATGKDFPASPRLFCLDQNTEGLFYAWETIDLLQEEITKRVEAIAEEDLCCLIYTSGTGGRPKGVMIPHKAILAILDDATEILSSLGLAHERFLSFLPLSHAYENVVGLFWPLALGAEIFYASSLDRLMEEMALARPTLMTAVPRLYEVIYQKMERQIAKGPFLRQKLFALTLKLGQKAMQRRLMPWEYSLNWLMNMLVRRKVREGFGGQLKAFISGGAALDPEIGTYFLALGLRILQGYGQTETCPVVSVNLPWKNKIATVGPPLPQTEVRLGDDQEILIRGPNVMMGYWQDAEATANALKGGWLHTGDLGAFDEDGFLRITGRKKDIIVLTGGDTISPAKIEQELCRDPAIEQAMVEGRDHLVALIVPSKEFTQVFDQEFRVAIQQPSCRQAMSDIIDRINRSLAQNEKIRRFAFMDSPFSIENQMLTPTLKIRRHIIRAHYARLLDSLL